VGGRAACVSEARHGCGVNQAMDAAALAALETQQRELSYVLMRLQLARRELVPPPATFWRGTARHAYDAAMDGLGLTADAAIAGVTAARDRTAAAIATMGAHG
jgi:hypothetical protein